MEMKMSIDFVVTLLYCSYYNIHRKDKYWKLFQNSTANRALNLTRQEWESRTVDECVEKRRPRCNMTRGGENKKSNLVRSIP